MKIKMSELQRIIKEEIEYALLEENVELEEGIVKNIGRALTGLAMTAGVAGAAEIPIKVVDMEGKIVTAKVIKAKDQRDALQKAQEAVSGMGQFFVEPSTEKEVREFQAGIQKPVAKASPAAASHRGTVEKINDKKFKVTGVNGDREAALDAFMDAVKKPVAGEPGKSTVNLQGVRFIPVGDDFEVIITK